MCLKGDGEVETRTLELSDFEGVQVSGNMRVFIKKGNTQQVEVKGQPNIIDELQTNVSGRVWDIAFDRCLSYHKTVQVFITVPQLQSASIGGSGYLELKDTFRTEDFEASVSGSGTMKLKLDTEQLTSRISGSGSIKATGEAARQDIKISGSGNYNSFEISSDEANVDISGSGKAQVNAKYRLGAGISGSGRVLYKGTPKVTTDISGSGRVIRRNE